MIKPGQTLVLRDGREVDAETVLMSEAANFAAWVITHITDEARRNLEKHYKKFGLVGVVSVLCNNAWAEYKAYTDSLRLVSGEIEETEAGLQVTIERTESNE